MILYAEVECLIYDVHSLKEKRSVVKRLIHKIKNEPNVAVCELKYHDMWNQVGLGIVAISNERVHAEKIMQDMLKIIDAFGEVERTITNMEWV